VTERADAFRRNDSLEGLLAELNGALGGAESALPLPTEPQLPTVLVVGPPRSGTTLTMQWLAASGAFAYPSNLLSRFYGSPYLGARIQQLLTDPRFNYKDELSSLTAHREAFRSELGKTKGPLEPNEFWYFWRRFVPLRDPEPLGDRVVDEVGLRGGLAALEAAFGLPFATKGILFQYDLPRFAAILPRALFVHTVRDRADNARSLLQARIAYWGDAARWFSVRPPGSERLLDATPEVQVAGQILATHRALETDLGSLPPGRSLVIDHEAFCDDPAPTWAALRERLRPLGAELPAAPPAAELRRSRPVSAEERARWDAAFDEAADRLAR
jgi:hypothetical protein